MLILLSILVFTNQLALLENSYWPTKELILKEEFDQLCTKVTPPSIAVVPF